MDSNELKRLLLNLLRKGEVIALDLEKGLCRVQTGELTTQWVPWFAFAAGTTRDWLPPIVGEQVMVLCPGGEPADAVVLRGYFSDDHPAPSNLPNLHTRHYPDGAVKQYDHEAHAFDLTLPEGGTVNIISPQAVAVKAEAVTVDSPESTFTGAVIVKGPFTFESGMTGKGGAGGGKTMQIDGAADFTGEVKSQGISLPDHDHIELGDGQAVSKPR
jgi:phage baseplate assembly protein V